MSEVKAAAKKRKKIKTRGRKSSVPDAVWEEVRRLYESGSYTQRELVEFLKKRGMPVSQPLISRKAVDEGWVKGTVLQKIRDEERERLTEKLGEDLAKMLGSHAQAARVVQGEVLKHFVRAQEMRLTDPSYTISPMNLINLSSALLKGQEMEARSMGFNYKEGKPFTLDNDKDQDGAGLVDLNVRTMTPQEEEEVRRKAEHGDEELEGE